MFARVNNGSNVILKGRAGNPQLRARKGSDERGRRIVDKFTIILDRELCLL